MLILDADIPYTPLINRPAKGAQVFQLDVDPLKTSMSVFHIDATVRANVHTVTALEQILEAIRGKPVTDLDARRQRAKQYNDARMAALAQAEATLPSDGSFTVPNLLARVRAAIPERTVLLNEGISNYGPTWNVRRRRVDWADSTAHPSEAGRPRLHVRRRLARLVAARGDGRAVRRAVRPRARGHRRRLVPLQRAVERLLDRAALQEALLDRRSVVSATLPLTLSPAQRRLEVATLLCAGRARQRTGL